MKKTAVVTGAGAGIGQAIALELAKRGYKVYANARSEEKIAETLKICSEYDVHPLIFDVQNLQQTEAALGSLEEIDCLVNNAGASMTKKSLEDTTEADWDRIIDTNAKGYFFVTKYALRKMSSGGSIVNMSSGAAKTGGDFVSIPYTTSKGAINSLTIAYARELAPQGIRVNAVSPGFIETDMLKLNEKPTEYYAPVIPLKFLGQPIDIANMVCYLISEEARYMTGQIIEVNGGDIMG